MEEQGKLKADMDQIEFALRNACSRNFGALDQGYLCQSIGILDPQEPLCVKHDDSLETVLKTFQTHKIGCVVVVDDQNKLQGIFSERDWIMKIAGRQFDLNSKISEFMTPDPITANMDTSLAFALNLMSEGGFRHLPILDDLGNPAGLISVKDLIDNLAKQCMKSLLDFELDLDLC
jgi:CBS domain-containing protein